MSARYRAAGLDYADSVFGIQPQFTRNQDAIAVTLSNLPELRGAALNPSIRYTLDGSEPDSTSAQYGGALNESVGTKIRAATFIGAERASRTASWDLDSHTGIRRSGHQLELCSNAVGLLLEPRRARSFGNAPLPVDVMNPCWIYRDVNLERGPRITAAVSALPFNYELGRDVAKIRVGDNRTPSGELEVRVDGCDGALLEVLPLPAPASADGAVELGVKKLPAVEGRHDVCLRFARPGIDPIWAIDWVEIQG
jgi:hexosaminidase